MRLTVAGVCALGRGGVGVFAMAAAGMGLRTEPQVLVGMVAGWQVPVPCGVSRGEICGCVCCGCWGYVGTIAAGVWEGCVGASCDRGWRRWRLLRWWQW